MTPPESWPDACARLASRLARAFEGIDRRLRRRPPAARGEGWSAEEIAEHVVLANHFLLLLAGKIAAKGVARRDRGIPLPREASGFEHLERLAARDFAWETPEHMRPTRSVTASETAAILSEQRRRALRLLARTRDGAGALHSISMSVAGARLDLYQLLAFVALHMERHARQMDRG